MPNTMKNHADSLEKDLLFPSDNRKKRAEGNTNASMVAENEPLRESMAVKSHVDKEMTRVEKTRHAVS